jgi:hypothetical protein
MGPLGRRDELPQLLMLAIILALGAALELRQSNMMETEPAKATDARLQAVGLRVRVLRLQPPSNPSYICSIARRNIPTQLVGFSVNSGTAIEVGQC